MNKLSKEYQEIARQYGFIAVRNRKHMIFKNGKGGMVVCPSSPSDSRRGIRQFEKDLKLAVSISR